MEAFATHLEDGRSPPVLRVSGEIDLATADEFRGSLEEALTMDSALVVDMADVMFIDVIGLRVLLQAAESRNGTGPLTLRNAPRVASLMKAAGLTDIPFIRFG
jgi:anti-anti-sigma factor